MDIIKIMQEGISTSKLIKLKDLERICENYEIPFKDVEWTFIQAGRTYFANREDAFKTEDDLHDCLNQQYAAALNYIKHYIIEHKLEIKK